MKTTIKPSTFTRGDKFRNTKGICALIAFLMTPHATAAVIDLGLAGDFAVLAGSTITFAGSGPTTITGDIGVHPGTSISGTENLVISGTNHGNSALTEQAKGDLALAFTAAAALPADVS